MYIRINATVARGQEGTINPLEINELFSGEVDSEEGLLKFVSWLAAVRDKIEKETCELNDTPDEGEEPEESFLNSFPSAKGLLE